MHAGTALALLFRGHRYRNLLEVLFCTCVELSTCNDPDPGKHLCAMILQVLQKQSLVCAAWWDRLVSVLVSWRDSWPNMVHTSYSVVGVFRPTYTCGGRGGGFFTLIACFRNGCTIIFQANHVWCSKSMPTGRGRTLFFKNSFGFGVIEMKDTVWQPMLLRGPYSVLERLNVALQFVLALRLSCPSRCISLTVQPIRQLAQAFDRITSVTCRFPNIKN